MEPFESLKFELPDISANSDVSSSTTVTVLRVHREAPCIHRGGRPRTLAHDLGSRRSHLGDLKRLKYYVLSPSTIALSSRARGVRRLRQDQDSSRPRYRVRAYVYVLQTLQLIRPLMSFMRLTSSSTRRFPVPPSRTGTAMLVLGMRGCAGFRADIYHG